MQQTFARLECETSRNLIVTRFIEEMLYAFSAHFFSMLLICTLVAGSISHFLTAVINFHFFIPTKLVSFVVFFFFISRSTSFSVIHVNFGLVYMEVRDSR